MNTLALILLAVGVLVAIVGVVVAAAGRASPGGPPAAGRGDWAAYDDGPGWADQGPGGQGSGSMTRGGLATLALGVVVALVGGGLLLFPVGDGEEDTVARDVPAQEWPQSSSAAQSPTTSPGAAPGEDDPESGPGTECGLVEPADGGPAQVRIELGSIGCSEAVRVVQKYYDLPVDPSGGNTAPQQFDGWRCSTATAGLAGQRGYGTSCLKGDVQLVVPVSDGAGAGGETAPTDSGARPDGDLGLPTPMTRPSCDGRGIVVLYSAVTPGAYESEIRSALASNPGARYLRTDRACPSLRQRDENGNVIYAVYRDSGYSRAELCADVASAPAGAYGRWLDTTSDPTVLVSC